MSHPTTSPAARDRRDTTGPRDTTNPTTTLTEDETTAASTKGWRVVDIVVAAVLGVAIGLVFLVWNSIGGAWFGAMDGVTPGLGGLAVGIWLLGGVVGGLVIRKPGAALLVEVIAAAVSAGDVVVTMGAGDVTMLGQEILAAVRARA